MRINNVNSLLNRSPILKRFIVGSSWLLGGGGITAVLNALSTFSLAAYLGVEQYGTLALILSTVALITGLMTLRTTEALTKFLIDFLQDKQKDKATAIVKLSFTIDFIVAFTASVTLYFSSKLIVLSFFETVELLQWFQLYSLTPLFVFCYATSTAILRVGDNFSVISGIEVAQTSIKCIGVLGLIFISASWQQILIWLVLATLLRGIALIWSVFYGLKKLNLTFSPFNGFSHIKKELKEVVWLMFTTSGVFVVKTAHTQADTVLVGMILGPASSGAYKLARSIIQLLAFPTNALFQVSFPEFTRLLKVKDSARFHNVMSNLMWATFGLCALYCLGTWFIAPYLLPLIIGDSYQQGIELLPILVVGSSLVLLSQYWHASLVAVNKAGQVAISMFLALIIQVSIIVLLLESYGIKIAAIAYVSYCLIRAMLLYNRFTKYVKNSLSEIK